MSAAGSDTLLTKHNKHYDLHNFVNLYNKLNFVQELFDLFIFMLLC